jgi:hypothetical protein
VILCSYLKLLKLLFAVLNSPFVIAIFSLSLGGVVAALLSHRYQRRQQVFELRVQAWKSVLDSHAKWLHTYLTRQGKENHQDWMQLLTLERYLRALFPGTEVETALKAYHDAAAELMKESGATPFGFDAQEEENKNIIRLQYALNDLTRVLVKRLGISEKD